VQLFNTDTGEDFAGFDFFDVVVDPGAFQIIRNADDWQRVTLSLFGDIPGASRFVSVGACSAGQAEWKVEFSEFNGVIIERYCIDINTLNQSSVTDRTIRNLIEGVIYTVTLSYVDGTPSNLGPMQFSRDFTVAPP
jgi:hypothetical protein